MLTSSPGRSMIKFLVSAAEEMINDDTRSPARFGRTNSLSSTGAKSNPASGGSRTGQKGSCPLMAAASSDTKFYVMSRSGKLKRVLKEGQTIATMLALAHDRFQIPSEIAINFEVMQQRFEQQ